MRLATTLTEKNGIGGAFSYPLNSDIGPGRITIDSKGNIAVAMGPKLMTFDLNGEFIKSFPCRKSIQDVEVFADMICTDSKRNMIIVDNKSHAIIILDHEYGFTRRFKVKNKIQNLRVTSHDNIVTIQYAESHGWQICMYDQLGNLLDSKQISLPHEQWATNILCDDFMIFKKSHRIKAYEFTHKGDDGKPVITINDVDVNHFEHNTTIKVHGRTIILLGNNKECDFVLPVDSALDFKARTANEKYENCTLATYVEKQYFNYSINNSLYDCVGVWNGTRFREIGSGLWLIDGSKLLTRVEFEGEGYVSKIDLQDDLQGSAKGIDDDVYESCDPTPIYPYSVTPLFELYRHYSGDVYIATDSRDRIIASGHKCVRILDPDGTVTLTITGPDGRRFGDIMHIAVREDDHILVTERVRKSEVNELQVDIFDPDGEVVGTENVETYFRNVSNDMEDATFADMGNATFAHPDANGRIYEKIDNSEGTCIRVTDSDGDQVSVIQATGHHGERIAFVDAFTVDRKGRIITVDKHRITVRVFEPSGKQIFQFSGVQLGGRSYTQVCDVAADSQGRILISGRVDEESIIQVFVPSKKQDRRFNPKNHRKTEEPLHILKIRYAKGQITEEQFDHMVKKLRNS